MRRILGFVIIFIVFNLLVGCGGGGSGKGSTPGAEESNANLSNLTISNGTLVFDPDKTSYSVELDYTVSSFSITPTVVNSQVGITINGTAVASGQAFGPVSLAMGQNNFQIIVTADNGSTTKTYTVVVTCQAELSQKADLAGLVPSAGALTPAFTANTTSYTAEVSISVASITVSPTAVGVNATITVNGTTVATGGTSSAISLTEGAASTITIVVTDQDGSTTKTYTLIVTRLAAKSTNAGLSGLSISQGRLSPAFSPITLSYTAEVQNTVTSLTVTPTASGVNAAIKVNGNAVTSGSPTYAIALNVGGTTINVVVTAEDGSTTKTYTVAVTCIPAAGVAPLYLRYYLPDQYNYVNNGGTFENEASTLFYDYTLTTGIDYGNGTLISGYALDQFVDQAAVKALTPDPYNVLGGNDARKLYAVVDRSNMDGFSTRSKFVTSGLYVPDVLWDQYNQGYLLDMNYSGRIFFPASLGLIKRYSIKYSYDIYMFRRIDVKRPDAAGSLATFEISATTDNYVSDSEYTTITSLSTTKFSVTTKTLGPYTSVRAIPLTQFLTDYVSDKPSSYTYKIVALDGTYKDGWTYAEMANAYYLPDYDLIIRVDGSNNEVSNTRVYFPVRIELIGAAYEYDYSAKNPPAFAKAYDE